MLMKSLTLIVVCLFVCLIVAEQKRCWGCVSKRCLSYVELSWARCRCVGARAMMLLLLMHACVSRCERDRGRLEEKSDEDWLSWPIESLLCTHLHIVKPINTRMWIEIDNGDDDYDDENGGKKTRTRHNVQSIQPKVISVDPWQASDSHTQHNWVLDNNKNRDTQTLLQARHGVLSDLNTERERETRENKNTNNKSINTNNQTKQKNSIM